MSKSRIHFVVLSLLFVGGCSSLNKQKDDVAALLNPRKIHGSFDVSGKAYKAAAIPVDDYYHALDIARSKYETDSNGVGQAVSPSDQSAIVNYVSEGIGLVDAYCRRWFQGLDDTNRMLAYQNKNINVITQLGTTLLGIGNASASLITGYGAANTAYAGLTENFNSAFLVAPTASKVKEHIESIMATEGESLRTASARLNFKQAYIRLERYADLCTHARAKAIVDSALDLTKTRVAPGTTRIETVNKATE